MVITLYVVSKIDMTLRWTRPPSGDWGIAGLKTLLYPLLLLGIVCFDSVTTLQRLHLVQLVEDV